MISALINGNFEVEEDRVTSSVFDNLLHLPDDMIWKIIMKSCYDNSLLPMTAGALLKYEFWPHWNRENTKNKLFVEPDLFLKFENISIIIEAKREYNKQGRDQWEKEILSYYNEYNDPVILLAIDGIDNENNDKITFNEKLSVNVYKSRWTRIFIVIKRCINEISNLRYTNINYILRTLSLIKDYLIFYGYSEEKWFYEILSKEIVFIDIEDSISLLRKYFKEVSHCDNNWFNSLIDKNLIINYDRVYKLLKKTGV